MKVKCAKRFWKTMLQMNFISHSAMVLITTLTVFTTWLDAASLPVTTSDLDLEAAYAAQPNEVLPIQPVLLYPQARELKYQARSLADKDDEIIYVKLLNRRNYRPSKRINIDAADDTDINMTAPKELSMKDIFYVKALANGQFSHHRVKWYRLPEFYAISVFHKGEQYEKQNLI